MSAECVLTQPSDKSHEPIAQAKAAGARRGVWNHKGTPISITGAKAAWKLRNVKNMKMERNGDRSAS